MKMLASCSSIRNFLLHINDYEKDQHLLFFFLAAVDCGPLLDPTFGRVTLTGTFFGNVATYECFLGYEIVGQVTRTCQSDGTWSGAAPECERKCLDVKPYYYV